MFDYPFRQVLENQVMKGFGRKPVQPAPQTAWIVVGRLDQPVSINGKLKPM